MENKISVYIKFEGITGTNIFPQEIGESECLGWSHSFDLKHN